MTTDDQIRDEKLQYDINKEAAKISALSSGKRHKYEYLTGEDILPSNQQQIIEQTNFTLLWEKHLKKKTKTIEGQWEKQIKALNTLKLDNKLAIRNVIPKNALGTNEAGEELDKIKKIIDPFDRENLVYKESTKKTYDFRKFRTIRTFGEDIYNGEITLEEADEYQENLLDEIKNFYDKARLWKPQKKNLKENTLNTLRDFYSARQIILNDFKSKIFLMKSKGSGLLNTDNSKLKMLIPREMLQRLPIALAQVKAGNNSENLLNKIREIIYSLYQSKEITKKVYNNLMKSL